MITNPKKEINNVSYTEVALAGSWMLSVEGGTEISIAFAAAQPADDFSGHTLRGSDYMSLTTTGKVWAKSNTASTAFVIVSQ